MKLGAHLSNNMGVRSTSCDDLFPYIVFAKGSPHDEEGVSWYVRNPQGEESGPFARAAHAFRYGMEWKKASAVQEEDRAHIGKYRVIKKGDRYYVRWPDGSVCYNQFEFIGEAIQHAQTLHYIAPEGK